MILIVFCPRQPPLCPLPTSTQGGKCGNSLPICQIWQLPAIICLKGTFFQRQCRCYLHEKFKNNYHLRDLDWPSDFRFHSCCVNEDWKYNFIAYTLQSNQEMYYIKCTLFCVDIGVFLTRWACRGKEVMTI